MKREVLHPIAGRLRLAYEVLMCAGLLLLIEVSLRRTTLPATCRRLHVRIDLVSRAALPGPDPLPRWTRPRVRGALLATARWPAGDTCLRRCLLLGNRLRALDPVLRIGVRPDARAPFHAHSWLEIDGRSLDLGSAEFAAMSRPPA